MLRILYLIAPGVKDCIIFTVKPYRHLLYDSRVTVVQVRLFFQELMEIALLSHLIILPGGIPEDTHLTNQTSQPRVSFNLDCNK